MQKQLRETENDLEFNLTIIFLAKVQLEKTRIHCIELK